MIQNSFTVLKIPYTPPIHASFPAKPGSKRDTIFSFPFPGHVAGVIQ